MFIPWYKVSCRIKHFDYSLMLSHWFSSSDSAIDFSFLNVCIVFLDNSLTKSKLQIQLVWVFKIFFSYLFYYFIIFSLWSCVIVIAFSKFQYYVQGEILCMVLIFIGSLSACIKIYSEGAILVNRLSHSEGTEQCWQESLMTESRHLNRA